MPIVSSDFEPIDDVPSTQQRLPVWQRILYLYVKLIPWLGGAFLIAFAGAVIFGPDFLKIGRFALFYWAVTITCGIALVLYGPPILFAMLVIVPMRRLMGYLRPIINMFKAIGQLLSGETPDLR